MKISVNSLSCSLRNPGTGELIKSEARRRQEISTRAEINCTENKKIIKKISETKSWLIFEMCTKIDKTWPKRRTFRLGYICKCSVLSVAAELPGSSVECLWNTFLKPLFCLFRVNWVTGGMQPLSQSHTEHDWPTWVIPRSFCSHSPTLSWTPRAFYACVDPRFHPGPHLTHHMVFSHHVLSGSSWLWYRLRLSLFWWLGVV